MMEITSSDRLRFGPYEVDLHTHELWKHGTRLKLVGQPFEILAVLVRRPGQLVTREELRSQLWPGDTFVDFNHGLNAAVNKLRDALCDSAEDPKYIETLPRRGYRFLGQVDTVESGQHQALIAPTGEDSEAVSGAEDKRELTSEIVAAGPTSQMLIDSAQPKRSKLVLMIAAVVALLAASLWLVGSNAIHGLAARRAAAREKEATEKKWRGSFSPLTNVPDPTSDAAFSPDGDRVAFRREGNSPETAGIFVKPVNSAQLLQLTEDAGDCCPVWSPDGISIAFSRMNAEEHSIYRVPATGGPVQKLYTGINSRQGELDWSPDGSTIVFVGETREGTSSIFALSLKGLTARPITEPPARNHDWGPTFSPDGETLAFIRRHETGLPESITVMPAAGGESRTVLNFNNGILGPAAWTADGQSLVFAAGVEPGLERVPAFGNGYFGDIDLGGAPASHPAIARRGNRLAFQLVSRAVSVWRSQFDGGRLESRRIVVTDAGRNEGARPSPDGSKLVFMSNRSGKMEIWVSDRDGMNATRLTWLGGVGSPRWSPDGRAIAFDATLEDHGSIFAVDTTGGGTARPVMQDKFENLVPSWSEDGKWIYFASNRTGIWQVWKVGVSGGSPVQVTTHGGFTAYELNGVIYYSKFNMPKPEVWEIPVAGGVESRVSALVRPETWASWAPVKDGIYFVEAGANGEPELMYYDSRNVSVRQLGQLPGMPFWLTADQDGKSVFYEHLDQESSRVVMVENFR
jgi:Tol biopolymer transport system component/DNA-binding winged helix-turn-helix (wHTH) protein